MPAAIVPAVRLQSLWQAGPLASNVKLKLYSNDVTPTLSSTSASFTQAVDPVSGTPIEWTLPSGSWTYTTDALGVKMTQPQVAGVFSGPLNIYGYWIEDLSGNIVDCQRFDSAPVVFASGYNAFVLPPQIRHNSPI